MKKLFTMCALIASAVLVGCGQKVEVGPAEIGKVMTSKGYQEGTIPTSKFRLDPCWTYCDKLVTLDVSDKSSVESVEVFMPEDKLLMTFGIQSTLTVNPKKAEALFTSLPPQTREDGSAHIAWKTIYETYAKQIILAESREFISKYNIPHLASNMETVNAQLRAHLTKQIEARTPFIPRYVGLVNVKFPQMIVDAQLNAAKRREQIQQEEAELEVSKVKLERELQEARLNRQIEIEKAETEAAAQKAQSQTITASVLELRRIENERLKWEKWNGQLPTTIIGEDAKAILSVK